MDDFAMDKIQISGAALASLLHRSSAAVGDIHGYLFGHVILITSSSLTDHPITDVTTSIFTATVTSFLSLPSHLPLPPPPTSAILLGCFSARRKSPLRPSLKDSISMNSFFSSTSLAFKPQNSNIFLPPSLFLLISTPFQDQLIHTHEYKAFQYRGDGGFEPKSLNIVNIGPSFRSQYDSFTPNVPFPLADFEMMNSKAPIENEEAESESLIDMKRNANDQNVLDSCADGYEIGRLRRLIGLGAGYSNELEDLYSKMLAKVDGLSKLVERTDADVLKLENSNMKLRLKLSGLD